MPYSLKEHFSPIIVTLANRFVHPKLSLMGIWQQIGEYLYLKKRDPKAPNTQWMKYMHGINRLSIFLFLFALIVLLLKIFVFKRHA